MIDTLITSHTRIRLLRKFFLNSNTRAHLRGLETEFGESSNAIRVELNRFESAGLLNSVRDGNKKLYQANKDHPLFNEIHSIVLKDTGIDRVIEKLIYRIGTLLCVYLTGDFAHGRDGHVIELIIVGQNIDLEYLADKVSQAEEVTGREIKYTVMDQEVAKSSLMRFKPADLLPVWGDDKNRLTP